MGDGGCFYKKQTHLHFWVFLSEITDLKPDLMEE